MTQDSGKVVRLNSIPVMGSSQSIMNLKQKKINKH